MNKSSWLLWEVARFPQPILLSFLHECNLPPVGGDRTINLWWPGTLFRPPPNLCRGTIWGCSAWYGTRLTRQAPIYGGLSDWWKWAKKLESKCLFQEINHTDIDIISINWRKSAIKHRPKDRTQLVGTGWLESKIWFVWCHQWWIEQSKSITRQKYPMFLF